MKRDRLRSLLLIPLLSLLAIGSNGVANAASFSAGSRAQLVSEARASLHSLYATSPKAKQLAAHAAAILVFPSVLKGGLMVGAAGGNGVLFRPDGTVLGYYNVASVSYGLQAGAQNFSEAMFLMKPAALNYLNSTDGLSVGSGPSVAVLDHGAGSDMSSTTLRSDIYALVFGQQGLMAGVGVQGQKITRLDD
ncbi:lipid-binding SYLF domain-containing protein [Paraburkholderia acidipaludis]|uniref:lipid-binding SYLF domain-containing protein n=1 Tax=Paraburkholderia acidipaludis TaxID=660537 RepID=UPI0004831D94|nr:YSC84-related protein [Paraburkholderia acidipaludis]